MVNNSNRRRLAVGLLSLIALVMFGLPVAGLDTAGILALIFDHGEGWADSIPLILIGLLLGWGLDRRMTRLDDTESRSHR